MDAFYVGAAFVLGLIFGSFGTVVAYRVPRSESIVSGRSHCPSCGRQINALENIPVLSWIFLKGRCRHCGEKISVRYPLTELTSGALFAAAVWKFDVSLEAFLYAAFFWVLIVLTVIDLEHKLLPSRVIYPALAAGVVGLLISSFTSSAFGVFGIPAVLGLLISLGVVVLMDFPFKSELATEPGRMPWQELVVLLALFAAWATLIVLTIAAGGNSSIWGSFQGAALLATFYFLLANIVGSGGLGGGDVRLCLLLGVFLGYISVDQLLPAFFFTSMVGGLVGVFVMLFRGGNRKTALPYGPFLAAGTVIAILWGQKILDLYLRIS